MKKEELKVSFGSFVKRNCVGIIGIIVTIIVAIVVSLYFYKKSIAKPEPVFLVDPLRIEIIDSKHFSETQLRVVRSNGNEIKGDVTSVRFYFWNNGRKSIKPSNILEPLVITLNDPNGEILDYKILKCSRKVVKPIVDRDSVDPNRKLSVSFAILEKEDGLTGQIIYEGNPTANFMISGTIENVGEIITNAKAIRSYVRKRMCLFILLHMVLCIFLFAAIIKAYLRSPESKPKLIVRDKMETMKKGILAASIVVVVSLVFGLAIFKIFEGEARTSVIQKVPKDIVP